MSLKSNSFPAISYSIQDFTAVSNMEIIVTAAIKLDKETAFF